MTQKMTQDGDDVIKTGSAKALLVVDVQPEAMKGRDTDGLVDACNEIIGRYPAERVFYIANLRPLAPEPTGNPFAEGLDIVSDQVLFKRRSDAFSNPALALALAARGVEAVEVIGIDGNFCVKATAMGALRSGLAVAVNRRAVVSKNPERFEATAKKLADAGVAITDE